MKAVVIGGGTGVYTALLGLKRHTADLTAVVSMADDGGSTGRLRDEFGYLPLGDLRRSIVALSADEDVSRVLRALLEYRFDRGEGLKGHSFGNLLLGALTDITGSTERAVEAASRLLNIRGRVLPVTTADVHLWAELADGTRLFGEHNIDVRTVKPEVPVRKVYLSRDADAYPPVLDAIRKADLVVLGPGDLYTSLLPNFLVRGVPEAVRASRGVVVYVCNLMTKHGETDGFTLSSFLSEVERYLGGPGAVNVALANSGRFSEPVLRSYAAERAEPVRVDREAALRYVPRVVVRRLHAEGDLVRHDPAKLGAALVSLAHVTKDG